MAKKNVLICNGGGPTAVINLTNMGIFEGCLEYADAPVKIYASMGGTGALVGGEASPDGRRHVARLDEYLADYHRRQLIKNTPSTWIGSGRYKLGTAPLKGNKNPTPQEKQAAVDADIQKVLEVCDSLEIGHVFFVGGDDTLTTLNALADYAERNPRPEWPTFLSVPKTIDNDLPAEVDDPDPSVHPLGYHQRQGKIMVCDTCPGFGTAANFIAAEVAHLAVEAFALKRHYVVEIMGRDAGFLTAAALAAAEFGYGPHMIALPEHGRFDIESFCRLIAARQQHEGYGVYCVSEGIRNAEGKPLASTGIDSFGNARLGGAGERLRDEADSYCGCQSIKADVRYIKPGEMHRICSYHRSTADAHIAYHVGHRAAFWGLVRGQTGKLVTIVRLPGTVPTWAHGLVDTKLVAGKKHKREVSAEWLSHYESHGERVPTVKPEFLDYLNPLIEPIVPISPAYDGPQVEV